jgi:hypothetical protein
MARSADDSSANSKKDIWRPPPDQYERPPTEAEVWEMVAGSMALLQREVARMLPRARRAELPDMFSDVVAARAQSIMRTWKPEGGGAWLTHLVANCRWYAYKWVHGRNGHWNEPRKEEQIVDPYTLVSRSPTDSPDFGVDLLLGSLPESDARLLRWRLLQGFDFDEMAEALHITRARCRSMYYAAVARARIRLWREGPAGMFLHDIMELLDDEEK